MSETQPFEGSVALFWVRKPAKGGCLENVAVRTVGDCSFFVGTLADDGSGDPRTGMKFWFPVKDVQMIMEFADLQQALAYKATFLNRKCRKRQP